MNDDGKTYESEISFKDLSLVQGILNIDIGNVINLNGGPSLVSFSIDCLPYLKLEEFSRKATTPDEFRDLCEPEVKHMDFVLVPGVFYDLIFKSISHGIEEKHLRTDSMKSITEGVRIGVLNARSEET